MDADRVGAYPLSVSRQTQEGKERAAPSSPHSPSRRRPPSWQEQQKRKAWGRFWGNANKGAMSR